MAYLPRDAEAMSEWEQRFGMLRHYLDRFHRRFSVLDLGCGDGQISHAIATHYDASCFLIDRGFNDTPEYATAHYEGVPRITCLKHDMTVDELTRLADCEHFDVVLALNFLHHFGEHWHAASGAVARMGWHVFLQLPRVGVPDVPGHDTMEPLHRFIGQTGGLLLGETTQYPGHLPRPLWLIETSQLKSLPFTTMFTADGYAQVPSAFPMQVKAAHDSIRWCRLDRGEAWHQWHVGMNLWNLLHLGLVRPATQEMAAELRAVSLPSIPHGDIVLWNFVWDGEVLHLIDAGGPIQREDCFGLEQAAQIVDAASPRRES